MGRRGAETIVSWRVVDAAIVDEVRAIALAEMRSVARAPKFAAPIVDAALRVPARALARSLAALDADTARFGLAEAGRRRLRGYRVAQPRHDVFAPPRWPGGSSCRTTPGSSTASRTLVAAIGRDRSPAPSPPIDRSSPRSRAFAGASRSFRRGETPRSRSGAPRGTSLPAARSSTFRPAKSSQIQS